MATKPNSLAGWLTLGAATVGAKLAGYVDMSWGEMAMAPFQGMADAYNDPNTSGVGKTWNVVVEGGKLVLGTAAIVGAGFAIAAAVPALAAAAGAGGLLAIGASTVIAAGSLAAGIVASNYVIDPILNTIKSEGTIDAVKVVGQADAPTDALKAAKLQPANDTPAAADNVIPYTVSASEYYGQPAAAEVARPPSQQQPSQDQLLKPYAQKFAQASGLNPGDPYIPLFFNHIYNAALTGEGGAKLQPEARKAFYTFLENERLLDKPAQPYGKDFQYPFDAKIAEATGKLNDKIMNKTADDPVASANVGSVGRVAKTYVAAADQHTEQRNDPAQAAAEPREEVSSVKAVQIPNVAPAAKPRAQA